MVCACQSDMPSSIVIRQHFHAWELQVPVDDERTTPARDDLTSD